MPWRDRIRIRPESQSLHFGLHLERQELSVVRVPSGHSGEALGHQLPVNAQAIHVDPTDNPRTAIDIHLDNLSLLAEGGI